MGIRTFSILLFALASTQSPATAGPVTAAISSFKATHVITNDLTPVTARRGGMAVRRGGVAVGPRGGVAYRRSGAVVGPRGGVVVRRSAGVVRPGWHGGGVRWARPAGYWWRPGGAIAAGAAIGFVSAATAVTWAGAAPAPNMCWYYTDPSRTQGFWDACP